MNWRHLSHDDHGLEIVAAKVHTALSSNLMRLRVERKLRKAIRRAEHHLPGLRAKLARYEQQQPTFSDAICCFAANPEEKSTYREHIANLLWGDRGAPDGALKLVALVANSGQTKAMAEYLRICWYSRRATLHPAELSLFHRVLANGTPEEQQRAIDGIASAQTRAVRRVLIEILNDESAPLDVRDRATEMLHLHESVETAIACANSIRDPNPSIRFWAAYTLGQITSFHKSLRSIAVPALESALNDAEIAPGWWSVGREAQAMIVGFRHDPSERERLQTVIRRVQADPNASPEERRWAEFYNYD